MQVAATLRTPMTPKPRHAATAARPVAPPQPNPASIAAGWLHTARFLTTAPELHFLPALEMPEIAFVGRSNAGKSTCINSLTQQKQLAFASRKPGRTQHINLFALGKQGATDAVFADLPGYGYAAVPRQDKIRWQQVMANYLVTRENLSGIVLLCDPRRGLTDLDEILLDVIRPRVEQGLKFLLLLTKADKLSKQQVAKAEQEALAVIRPYVQKKGCPLLNPLSVSAGLSPGDERMKRLEDRMIERLGSAFASI